MLQNNRIVRVEDLQSYLSSLESHKVDFHQEDRGHSHGKNAQFSLCAEEIERRGKLIRHHLLAPRARLENGMRPEER